MSDQSPPQPAPEHVSIGGWIARAIAVTIFIPLRLLWEGCKLAVRIWLKTLQWVVDYVVLPVGRFAKRWIVRPVVAFVKDFLWGWLLQHLLWGAILTPLGAIVLDFLLRPLKRAVEEWLWRRALRPALSWLYRRVLAPSARWIMRWLVLPVAYVIWRVLLFVWTWFILWPLRMIYQWILRPIGWALSFIGGGLIAVLVFGWAVATAIVGFTVVAPCRYLYRNLLRPLFALIARMWRATVVHPMRWIYTSVVRPMNKWVSDIMTATFGR